MVRLLAQSFLGSTNRLPLISPPLREEERVVPDAEGFRALRASRSREVRRMDNGRFLETQICGHSEEVADSHYDAVQESDLNRFGTIHDGSTRKEKRHDWIDLLSWRDASQLAASTNDPRLGRLDRNEWVRWLGRRWMMTMVDVLFDCGSNLQYENLFPVLTQSIQSRFKKWRSPWRNCKFRWTAKVKAADKPCEAMVDPDCHGGD